MEETIKAFLEEIFKEEGLEDCFFVEMNLVGDHKLTIYLDCDSGMSFRKCQRVSRMLESRIEEQGLMSEKYTLDVSSPGTDRPLKFQRQYTKNIGRKLKVKNEEGETFEGTLTLVNDEGIRLEYKERIKEGKKKKTIVVEKDLLFQNINKAIVKTSF